MENYDIRYSGVPYTCALCANVTGPWLVRPIIAQNFKNKF